MYALVVSQNTWACIMIVSVQLNKILDFRFLFCFVFMEPKQRRAMIRIFWRNTLFIDELFT